jgi:chemotaxis protein methyltransferase CheR
LKDADCVAFLQWALPKLGLAWPGYRKVRGQVCKRIARRLRQLDLVDARQYSAHLESHAGEWQALAALCTVTISRFYRDPGIFECLGARVLPELAQAALARGASRLECWSAGCASGEEPYTLAIQWHAALAERFPALGIHVLGTDIDSALLERAHTACYRAGSLKELPADWRQLAFEQREGLCCLRQVFREGVELRTQDLLEGRPQQLFDLVLCRNLAFTYFAVDRARSALASIGASLRSGGALVIGAQERLPGERAGFTAWPGCRAIFRRAPLS